MATFSMAVTTSPLRADFPYIDSDSNTDCIQTMVITVPVPVGQSRYVTVVNTGTGTNPATYDRAETITTETNYTLEIDGFINSDPSANTEYSTVVINVRLSASDPIFYSKQISRQHSVAVC